MPLSDNQYAAQRSGTGPDRGSSESKPQGEGEKTGGSCRPQGAMYVCHRMLSQMSDAARPPSITGLSFSEVARQDGQRVRAPCTVCPCRAGGGGGGHVHRRHALVHSDRKQLD
ncbi:hypothetical protein L227DRAFT_417289 [Lentinus tigrinus ALCF2SS1-6]|uniref:Uncharacterized protein n=1 Tax=Lentinus tigrinus ALCF2SS1-6 TaxID=1328759 RepID=A0A5C2SIY9_9APHY|nr:hypothetical protein L227DRAFT_417289 [Lentinus tigrinus ALCF2SS1-6]